MPYPQQLDEPAIIDAAIELVAKGPYDRPALRPVAYKLGVNVSGLYRYFRSVSELHQAVGYRVAGEMILTFPRTLLTNRSSRSPVSIAALEAVARRYLKFAHGNRRLYRLIFPHCYPCGGRPTGYMRIWRILVPLVSRFTQIEDDRSTTLGYWSYLHGLAMLNESWCSEELAWDPEDPPLFEEFMNSLERKAPVD